MKIPVQLCIGLPDVGPLPSCMEGARSNSPLGQLSPAADVPLEASRSSGSRCAKRPTWHSRPESTVKDNAVLLSHSYTSPVCRCKVGTLPPGLGSGNLNASSRFPAPGLPQFAAPSGKGVPSYYERTLRGEARACLSSKLGKSLGRSAAARSSYPRTRGEALGEGGSVFLPLCVSSGALNAHHHADCCLAPCACFHTEP